MSPFWMSWVSLESLQRLHIVDNIESTPEFSIGCWLSTRGNYMLCQNNSIGIPIFRIQVELLSKSNGVNWQYSYEIFVLLQFFQWKDYPTDKTHWTAKNWISFRIQNKTKTQTKKKFKCKWIEQSKENKLVQQTLFHKVSAVDWNIS